MPRRLIVFEEPDLLWSANVLAAFAKRRTADVIFPMSNEDASTRMRFLDPGSWWPLV